MSNNILTLIPARAGSKGIPGKNTKLCGGRPLIEHTFRAAKSAKGIGRIFVSSDSSEIHELAKKAGVEVPFNRPDELSGDEAPVLKVMQHFLEWTKKEKIPCDAVMLLQPTSPLRTTDSIERAITLFCEKQPDSLVSMVKIPHSCVPSSAMKLTVGGIVKNLEGGKIQPASRQKKEILYARNGPAILIVKKSVLESGSLYGDQTIGFEMSAEESLDIDHMHEFNYADFLLSGRVNV